MATSTQLRRSLSDLTLVAWSDLSELWRSTRTAQEASEALFDLMPALVSTYGSAAATIAADWYDELRDERENGGGTQRAAEHDRVAALERGAQHRWRCRLGSRNSHSKLLKP